MNITIIIIAILFAVTLAGIIYGFLSRLGEKRLLKDYEKDYEDLKWFIENCPVTMFSRGIIEINFNKLTRYRCRNDEKIDILQKQYKRKFGDDN